MAKAYAAEAANDVTAECIQIHGGVGFTWDCDAHLFYRKAKQADLLFGYQGWQREAARRPGAGRRLAPRFTRR